MLNYKIFSGNYILRIWTYLFLNGNSHHFIRAYMWSFRINERKNLNILKIILYPIFYLESQLVAVSFIL